jgi:two-component system chemotaxis response regulator CheY
MAATILACRRNVLAIATGLAALRILVIDDSREMCTIVGTVLSAAGVGHLHYAPDGRRGLEVMSQYSIDLAYVDHEMPVMNGLEFISAVRALDSSDRYMPIIMLTGHSDIPRLNAARDSGVTEFLCKPVTAKTILTRLNAVIMEPRPFVMSPGYFGPDRRRTRKAAYKGPRRRGDEAHQIERQTG